MHQIVKLFNDEDFAIGYRQYPKNERRRREVMYDKKKNSGKLARLCNKEDECPLWGTPGVTSIILDETQKKNRQMAVYRSSTNEINPCRVMWRQ